jgi:hypothetical protein
MVLFGMTFLAKGRNKIKMIQQNKAPRSGFSGLLQPRVATPARQGMEDHQDDVMARKHDCDCIRDRFDLKAGGAHKSKAAWSGLTTFG